MMAFSIRSIGKCKYRFIARCTDPVEYCGDIAGDSRLILYFVLYSNTFIISSDDKSKTIWMIDRKEDK